MAMDIIPIQGNILPEYPSATEFLEFLQTKSREVFLKDGHHVGMFFYNGPSPDDVDKIFCIFPVDQITYHPDPEVQGHRRALLVRNLAKRSVLGAFIAEGWIKSFDEGEITPDMPEEEIPRPSDYPIEERGECLMITLYIDGGLSQQMFQAIITRDETGQPSLGEWNEITKNTEVRGRLVVSDEERAEERMRKKAGRAPLN